MKTVVDEKVTEWLASNGYFYVMHRFDIDVPAYAKAMRAKGLFVSISVGVKQPDYEVVNKLAEDGVGADYITIDIGILSRGRFQHQSACRKLLLTSSISAWARRNSSQDD